MSTAAAVSHYRVKSYCQHCCQAYYYEPGFDPHDECPRCALWEVELIRDDMSALRHRADDAEGSLVSVELERDELQDEVNKLKGQIEELESEIERLHERLDDGE